MKRIVSFLNPKQKKPFHNHFLVMKRIFSYEKNCTTHPSGTVDGRWYTSPPPKRLSVNLYTTPKGGKYKIRW